MNPRSMFTSHGIEVVFPQDIACQRDYELMSKGYCAGIKVTLPNGATYVVFVATHERIRQELASTRGRGEFPVYLENGLIIVESLSTDLALHAVDAAWIDGFFEKLVQSNS